MDAGERFIPGVKSLLGNNNNDATTTTVTVTATAAAGDDK